MSRIFWGTAIGLLLSTAGCGAQSPSGKAPAAVKAASKEPQTLKEFVADYEQYLERGSPRAWVVRHGTKHVQQWQAEAEKGDADAAFLLSLAMDAGVGVEPNRRAASRWLIKAAEAKQPLAMCELAVAMFNHPPARPGIGWDQRKAFDWLKQSIQADCTRAKQLWLEMISNGYGPAFKEAFELTAIARDVSRHEPTRTAFQNLPEGLDREIRQDLIARLLISGLIAIQLQEENVEMMRSVAAFHHREVLSLKRDPEASRRWLQKAAERDSIRARWELAQAHLTGEYGFPVDPAAAQKWLDQAVTDGGCDGRRAAAGVLMNHPGPIRGAREQAARLLQEAAAEGDLEALRTLGKENGPDGRLSQDSEVGMRHFRTLAERGDGPGMFHLARQLTAAAPNDPARRDALAAEARRWLEKAAARDNAAAMLELFEAHANRRYPDADPKRGLAYLQSAAQLKEGRALYRLAEVHARGQFGVSRDVKRAEQLLRDGVADGSTECMFELGFSLFRGATALDFAEANSGYWLMHQAARLGHTEAQYQVGLSHLKPDGAPGNQLERDVNDLMGRATGAFELRELFSESPESIRGKRGVDLKTARMWLDQAAKQGHAGAKRLLAEWK